MPIVNHTDVIRNIKTIQFNGDGSLFIELSVKYEKSITNVR